MRRFRKPRAAAVALVILGSLATLGIVRLLGGLTYPKQSGAAFSASPNIQPAQLERIKRLAGRNLNR